MDLGAHLPLLGWPGEEPPTLASLTGFVRRATELGFTWLSANDHIVYGRPWLDGPTALAVAVADSGTATLATSISLPVVRGPGPLAKAMAAIDRLSGGRVVIGVGPGSSERDYEAMGIAWSERWPRFEEAVQAMHALLRPGGEPFIGRFYSTEGIELLPAAARPGGPPIWIGSWGSEAGVRRVARLADGWLASGYNATPSMFADARARLHALLAEAGTDPSTFPNAVVSIFTHVTEDRAEADALLADVLAPMLHRDPSDLHERLFVGPAGEIAAKAAAFRDAGAERIAIWPVGDPVEQLERFAAAVAELD
ncbi:MAG TPA: LLM class flavin-dependent oxidoreductase [Actinomycetota bacterium]|nr:LLM class flavin-dependent oxidoreductase [Actinomycetota bacterium]